MLALGPFAPGGGSVSSQVGEGGSHLVRRCSRVGDDNVNEEGIRTLNILDVSASTTWAAVTGVDLTHNILHAEMGLCDSGVESFDKLVELIADGVVTDVAEPLVETAAEGV